MNPLFSKDLQNSNNNLKKSLKEDVRVLTTIDPPRNHTNISSLNRIAEYILEEFKRCDFEVFFQKFLARGKEYKNIVASKGGTKKKRIIVGAHYDVYGNQPGADDNASGIAGLLGLARLVKKREPELKYRLELVAFCLEEPPFFNTEFMGSYVHAKSLFQKKASVKLMINLDMIGYYSKVPGSQKYPSFVKRALYPDSGNFIAVMGRAKHRSIIRRIKKYMKKGSKINILSIIPPKSIRYIGLSDHINYWKFGFHAVLLSDTASYRNSNYHRKTDTMDTLNFDKMAELIKGLYNAIIKL